MYPRRGCTTGVSFFNFSRDPCGRLPLELTADEYHRSSDIVCFDGPPTRMLTRAHIQRRAPIKAPILTRDNRLALLFNNVCLLTIICRATAGSDNFETGQWPPSATAHVRAFDTTSRHETSHGRISHAGASEFGDPSGRSAFACARHHLLNRFERSQQHPGPSESIRINGQAQAE